MNMVRARVREYLRMRKQNTKTTAPLDVVPDRRTKRFPPRPRSVGRFCDLRLFNLIFKVDIPIVTDRQTGRDKSAPRPYKTDPIHPLSSIHRQYQFLSI